jgi:hypothetical protein
MLVYLSDISIADFSQSSDSSQLLWQPSFNHSRWFTRGWTLQELLAPVSVEFFSREGIQFGDKESLEPQIQQIIGIPAQALQGDPLSQFSIEKRMSWIGNRETTIEENIVYSLLGIFDIHMPLIYGEGVIKALRRLGVEIEKLPSVNEQCKPITRNSECPIANLYSEMEPEGTTMPTSAA